MLVAQHSTYKRHRPEQTLLYQLVESHYPEFIKQLSDQGKSLPRHVEKEFAEFLKCGRLEHGFLRVICDDCKHEKLVAFSCKRRGFYSGGPDSIVSLVNEVGEPHSAESIFLYTHGFERLLLDRKISKSITSPHIEVAKRLLNEGTVTELYQLD